ncbi:YtxH domain-containing protein [Sporolactobacillus spathodeae]|uniref:Gas vesicle protein n=1 Tax=Sporolactobacillus spathodeae TaxID=1465502 RepID=A0ABS2QAQ9_9BACL|nr:YtxH domain-containing protein [Sporolactobacillus spathodeae]MBM7658883.1 gas vesicle protein [Sporolactobacillus spathodeae]
MKRMEKQTGSGLIFASGFLTGGLVAAVSIFLIAAPSGRKVIDRVRSESISLKGKSSGLFETAKQKSIALTKTMYQSKNQMVSPSESEKMIPIPKDYVSR